MQDINRVAIDLAKNVFQVCALNIHNKVLFNKKLSRKKFIEFMVQLPISTIYMEACYSAHYWGRTLKEMGHTPFLIPAQHVTPFVRGNKNDNNDALAIAEAANRPGIRFVPIKTVQQQEIMAMHRLRTRLVKSRTQVSNQARGLLSDFGIIFPLGTKAFIGAIISLQDDERLSPAFRQLMLDMRIEFGEISNRINLIEEQLKAYIQETNHCAIVSSVPGIGIINASAIVASIDKGQAFKNPREFAVWLGLTPRQYASGDKSRLGGITKRGDRYLRTQLIHAARAAKKWSRKRDDQLSLWIRQLEARVGTHKATVAIAHKLARIIWVLLQKQQPFTQQYTQEKVAM
ncbi:MAG TPA: IS110 family transposase [Leucothrix sp.]|nr:IS110 family transposase [Leucothrix sp.]